MVALAAGRIEAAHAEQAKLRRLIGADSSPELPAALPARGGGGGDDKEGQRRGDDTAGDIENTSAHEEARPGAGSTWPGPDDATARSKPGIRGVLKPLAKSAGSEGTVERNGAGAEEGSAAGRRRVVFALDDELSMSMDNLPSTDEVADLLPVC